MRQALTAEAALINALKETLRRTRPHESDAALETASREYLDDSRDYTFHLGWELRRRREQRPESSAR